MILGVLSPDEWRQSGRSFPHHGQEIFYRDSGGSLPPLLLIHGFPTASWDFYRMWDALTQRYRVLAPDLIGFGFSAKPFDYPYSILDQAELCAKLCARQQLTEIHVLAHDYGVSVAQELLTMHEEGRGAIRIKSIAYLNGGLFPETHRPLLVQKLLRSPLGPLMVGFMKEEKLTESMQKIFGPKTQPNAQECKAFWQLVSHNDGRRIMPKLIRYIDERIAQRGRWVPAMQFTKVPMRLINGQVDPVSGEHMAARYHELIPNPDIVLLPGIGHYPQVEAPDLVLQALFDFHERVKRAR
ncbi:MAG: alpha/beta hydrolase [Pseudomonadota bacterium]